MKKNDSYIILSEKSSIKDALVYIKNNNSRHVFITSKNEKVIGVISEGDILDALLRGIDLSSGLNDLINRSFVFLTEDDMNDKSKILRILNQGILIIPVLNQRMELINVINYLDYLE
tara:strand:- start:26 stop:376 length:351 start_codon:yes stop_codon:yes gene_type:complete